MAKLSEAKRKEMRKLFEENGLTPDDVFTHKHFIIITRSGIEKIQANKQITVTFDEVRMERDFVVLKATARMEDNALTVQTYGEAGPENCKNTYYVMTAEKRALSRAVLKLVGLYEHGVYSEDEGVQDE